MSTQTLRHTVLRAAAFATIVVAITGCDRAAPTEPQRAPRSAMAVHDDDPATCRSGYQVIDGHVVCN
jgi:hypothetical protein